MSRSARPLLLCTLCALFTLPASADKHPVTTTALPAQSGVTSEAQTIIDAPARRVAELAGDPAAFVELFPAEQVQVLSGGGARQVVQVVMREPWPVGVVRWTESVARSTEPDRTLVVQRQAQAGGYFRRLEATWRVRALPPEGGKERCAVTYRVSMELQRWVPLWMLRRGHTKGMVATIERLRQMAGRPSPPPRAPAPVPPA